MNAKKWFCVMGGCLAGVTSLVRASAPDGGGPLGLGLMVGAPIGVTAKYWISPNTAWDAAFGTRSGDVQLHGDYLWHPEWIKLEHGVMPFYLGLGGRVHFKEDTVWGIRFVAGLAYHLPDYPFEFFGEAAPSLRFAPSVGSDVDAAVGVRYYFRIQGSSSGKR